MKLREEEVGKIIAEARKKKNITQERLAAKLGITDKAVSNWETGKNFPDVEAMGKLESILDINIKEVLEEPIYIRNNKILVILLTLIVIIFVPFFLYFIFNYNRINVYSVSLDSEKYVIEESFITSTNNKIIIDLNQIELVDIPYELDIKFTLYYKDEILLEKEKYDGIVIYENKKDLSVLNKKVINHLDDLYIKIEYKDIYDSDIVEEIGFIIKRIDGSERFFLKKDYNTKKIDNSLFSLLKNNDYKRAGVNLYEKKVDDILYQFDTLNNVLSINYCKEDYCVEGKMSSLVMYKYTVRKDGKIVDYRLLDERYSGDYHSEVSNLLKKEYVKIIA